MFKPTNPQIKILKQEITQIEELLLESERVWHQIDETQHEIENFNSFISNMEEIAYLINSEKQSINELQNQLNNISTKSLELFINMLENEVKSKKQLVQKMIDDDFYSFMETMNEENTMEVYLSSDTATTPIMDEFYNSPKIDFLIFKHLFSEEV